MQAVELER